VYISGFFWGFFWQYFTTWQQHENPSATHAKDFSEKRCQKSPDFEDFFCFLKKL
jgi:hypothetical protein